MKHKKIVLFALTLYILALFYILFFCRINSDNGMAYNEWLSTSINIMPLKNVFIFLTTPYITPSYVFSFIKNIFGNIMLFLPMGYFLPCLFNKSSKVKIYIIINLFFSLFIEITQVIFMLGSFDVDDIILNVLGSVIGFYLFGLIRKIKFNCGKG